MEDLNDLNDNNNEMTVETGSSTQSIVQSSSPLKDVGARPIAMSPNQNSSSSFIPSKSVRISNNSEEYYTHFTKLKPSSRKGQTRYRCKTCLHEFECSGKIRRIQHILGNDLIIAKEKNVRSCPKPHEPLKAALLDLYRSLSGKVYAAPPLIPPPVPTIEVPPPNPFPLQMTMTTEMTNESPSWQGNLISSSGSIDTVEDPWIDNQSQLNVIPHITSSDSLLTYPTLDLYASQQANFEQANQALLRFLYKYDLPLSAMEDPIFTNFIEAVASTDEHYEPSMIDENVFED